MPCLIWSAPALRDVQRLYRFVAEKNIDAAKRAAKSLREGAKVVAHQPGIGRPADGMEPEYREWMINFGDSGYVVLYRYDGQTAWPCAISAEWGTDMPCASGLTVTVIAVSRQASVASAGRLGTGT